jgi:hypothetical protein
MRTFSKNKLMLNLVTGFPSPDILGSNSFFREEYLIFAKLN